MQLRAFVHFSEQKLWQTTHVPWQQAQAGGRLLQWKQQQRRVRSTYDTGASPQTCSGAILIVTVKTEILL